MVKVSGRLRWSVFWSFLLFATISFSIFSNLAFSEEVLLSQAEKDFAQAEVLRDAKKYDEAKSLYQSVARDSDTSMAIKGLTGIGRCEIQLGNTAAAEQLIQSLKTNYTQHADLCARIYDLSYEYWYKQDYAKSMSHCQYIKQTFPDSEFAIKAQRGIARCLVRQSDIKAAELAADKLLNDYSGHEGLCDEVNALSFEFWFKGHHEKSKALWEYVAANTTNQEQAMNARSKIVQCEFIAGNYDKVEELVEAFKADYPGKNALYGLLKDIAGRYYKKQIYDTAAVHYRYLAQNHPNSVEGFKAQMRVVDSMTELDDINALAVAIYLLLTDFAEVPDHTKNIYLFANDYYKGGKYSNAETLYQFVANSNDADLAIKATADIVSCKVAAGNLDQADQVLDILKSNQSDNPKLYENLFSLGERLLKLDKRDRAMDLYSYIAQNAPGAEMKIKSQTEAVRCRILAGDAAAIDSAIEKFKSDFQGNPLGFDRMNYIANKLRESGRYDKASNLFMYISQNTTDSDIAQKAGMRAVISLIKAKDYEGAEQLFDQFWNKYRSTEGFVENVVSICNIFERVNDPAMALPYINRALGVVTDLKQAIRLLRLKAMCYIDMGAEEQAKAVQEDIDLYSNAKDYPSVRLAIADKYYKNDQYDKAMGVYSQIVADHPRTAAAMASQAAITRMHFINQEDDKVLATYEKLAAEYKGLPRYDHYTFVVPEEYYFQGMEAMKNSQFDKSQAYFTMAKRLWEKADTKYMTPRLAPATVYFLGRCSYLAGDVDTAIQSMQKVISDYPNSDEYVSFSRYSIAKYAPALMKDPERTAEADALTEKYLKEFIEKHPNEELHVQECLRNLGGFYYRKGQYANALDRFEELIEKDYGKLGKVVDMMAVCYQKLGYPESAEQIRNTYQQSLNK